MILRKKKSEITGIQRPPNLEACYLSQAYFSFFSPAGPSPTVTSLSWPNTLWDLTQTTATARNALSWGSNSWESPNFSKYSIEL